MLDIAFHIAVLVIVVFAIGLFIFHHSFYNYLLGSMKSAIQEKMIGRGGVQGGTVNAQQPAQRFNRKESDIEKAVRQAMEEPAGTASQAGTR